MLLKASAMDAALLALIQLLQPASQQDIEAQARDTVIQRLARTDGLAASLKRLTEIGYLLRTGGGHFVVAPIAYSLIELSLSPKIRDKSRLLFLNEKRTKRFGLGA